MKRLVFFLGTVIFAPLTASAQLSPADLAEAVIARDSGVIAASVQENIALRNLRIQDLSGRPRLAIAADPGPSPLYGYSKTRIQDFADPYAPSYEDFESHSFGLGATVSQGLPTGGTLALSGSDSLTISRTGDQDWAYAMSPSAGVSLTQPLALPGPVVDVRAAAKAREASAIDLDRARVSSRQTRNRSILSALSLAGQVDGLRQSLAILSEQLRIAETRLDQARGERDQGTISRADYLAQGRSVTAQRETILDLRSSLLKAEQSLAASLGIPDLAGVELDLSFPNVAIPMATDRWWETNPNVRQADATTRSTELARETARAREFPSLTISANLSPRYADGRADGGLGASITDFLDENAGIDYSIQLGFRWSPPGPAVRSERDAIDRLSINHARETRDQAIRAARDRMAWLMLDATILDEKRALAQSGVDYAAELLRIEEERYSAGLSTDLDAAAATLELRSRRNDLERLAGQRYIAVLEIYAEMGDDLMSVIRNHEEGNEE